MFKYKTLELNQYPLLATSILLYKLQYQRFRRPSSAKSAIGMLILLLCKVKAVVRTLRDKKDNAPVFYLLLVTLAGRINVMKTFMALLSLLVTNKHLSRIFLWFWSEHFKITRKSWRMKYVQIVNHTLVCDRHEMVNLLGTGNIIVYNVRIEIKIDYIRHHVVCVTEKHLFKIFWKLWGECFSFIKNLKENERRDRNVYKCGNNFEHVVFKIS